MRYFIFLLLASVCVAQSSTTVELTTNCETCGEFTWDTSAGHSNASSFDPDDAYLGELASLAEADDWTPAELNGAITQANTAISGVVTTYLAGLSNYDTVNFDLSCPPASEFASCPDCASESFENETLFVQYSLTRWITVNVDGVQYAIRLRIVVKFEIQITGDWGACFDDGDPGTDPGL